VVGAAIVLHKIDPNQPGHYPSCPSLWITGFYCPGCGSLRAIHALTEGDLLGAWNMNPALVVALPFLIYAWISWAARIYGWRKTPKRLIPGWAVMGILLTIIAYWFIRNVPALAPLLAPGGIPAPFFSG
jgi:hypothetical protein